LQKVAKESDVPVANTQMIPPAKRQQMVYDWNDPAVPFPSSKIPTPQLIATQATQSPTQTAVRCQENSLSYAELDTKSNQLAHLLQAKGVTSNTLVGIMMHRSTDMLVALLAIWKAGGAYVPLDPNYPADRLQYMVDHSGLSLLISETSAIADLPTLAPTATMWPTLVAEMADQPTAAPTTTPDPEDLAYVIYTSGSTGRPKGVQVPHRALTNLLLAMQSKPGITADSVFVAITTLSFDIHALELWLPLISGSQLVIATQDEAVDGIPLANLLDKVGATHLQATPATWKLLLESDWHGRTGLKMLCGGEALPTSLAKQLGSLGGELWNMYGPTETTIWSSVAKIEPEATITIGRPIANTQMYILSDALEPVIVGATGELYIGGDGVTHGYWQQDRLTAERFIDNPFHSGKMYRTGDLARFTMDGEIECLGRVDHQVKMRGFRIELGEIEAVLRQHDSVPDAVVLLREDTPGDKLLVAYVVVGRGSDSVDTAVLTDYLDAKLPYYMTPAAFVTLDQLPLTLNGKIDRNQLPQPDYGAAAADQYAPPQTETEHALAKLWSDVLTVERVGIHSSFFALGGYSLLAHRLINRIAKEMGVRLSLLMFFDTPTIAEIGRYIDFAKGNAANHGEDDDDVEEFIL